MFQIPPGPRAPELGKNTSSATAMLGIFALIMLVMGGSLAAPSFIARGWPVATGTITESRVQTTRSSKSTTYHFNVTYRFDVDGVGYVGHRVDRLVSSGSESAAYEDQKRWPAGASCDVHYDPTDPANCCLRPGPGGFQVGGLVVAVLLAAGAVVARIVRFWQTGPEAQLQGR
jgi:hypothetical protein